MIHFLTAIIFLLACIFILILWIYGTMVELGIIKRLYTLAKIRRKKLKAKADHSRPPMSISGRASS